MTDNKRHKNRVCIKLTDEEYNGVKRYIASLKSDEDSTQKKITFSEGLRVLIKKALTLDQQTAPGKPCIDRELVLGIQEEVRNIGKNVGKLTKNMNAALKDNQTLSPSVVSRLVNSLDMIDQHLDDMLKRLTEFSTK